MVWVYGFDEFVEPTIRKRNGVFHAENYYGQRPLEVAALYRNYSTMITVYNAASSTHASSIRANKWLQAAAASCNLAVWNFALKHIPNIPLKDAVVFAAQNPVHGKEMVSSLLENAVDIDIDEKVLAEILAGCTSLEILNMILTYSPSVRFTESMMEAAVRNPFINPELTEMILSNYPDLWVSSNCILSALLESHKSTPSSRAAVIRALLSHSAQCEISEEMICIMGRFSDGEDVECLGLLLQHCSVDHITEDWLVAAAGNLYTGSDILEFFLNHALGHTITSKFSKKHC